MIIKLNKHNFKKIFNDDDLLKAADLIFPISKHYQEILKIHLRELKDCKNIIDLGCGTGILTIEYLKEDKIVTGIDKSKKSLQYLKKKANKLPNLKNLTIIEEDISNLKQINNKSFEGVSSMIVAHLLKNYNGHIKECYRILKSKGRLIITARAKCEDQEIIIKIIEKSLLKTKNMKKYEKDFIILKKKLLKTAQFRSISLFTTDEAIKILKKSGFVNIQKFPNKTSKVMYSLLAEKN